MFTTNTEAQFHAHEHEKEFRTVGSLLAHTWKKSYYSIMQTLCETNHKP